MPSLPLPTSISISIALALTLLLSLLTPSTTASPLSPRAGPTPTCLAIYGTDIAPHDCVSALGRLPAFGLGLDSGAALHSVPTFSRNHPSAVHRLPQSVTVGTCTVFVDIIDPTRPAWSDVGAGVGSVILECADRARGVGGRMVEGGLFMAVLAAKKGVAGGDGDVMGRVRTDLCIARRGAFKGEWKECLAAARVGVSASVA